MIHRKNNDPARPYPLMWDGIDYEPLPLESLSIDSSMVRLMAPYCVTISFFSTTQHLNDNRGETDGGLIGRNILPQDILIFDQTRTTPLDGAIMQVQDGRGWIARVCHILADGAVEFHAAAEGFPILTGARKIYGTLAAVVRATDGREVTA